MRAIALALAIIGCDSSEKAPTLDSLEPNLVCDRFEEPVWLTLEGDNLSFVVEGALTNEAALAPPEVVLVPTAGLAEGSEPATSRRVKLRPSGVKWKSDTELQLKLDDSIGLRSATYDVEVTVGDRTATLENALAVVGTPTLTGFDPAAVCHDRTDAPVGLVGTGLVRFGDQLPTADIGGQKVTANSGDQCAPFAVAGIDGQVCERFVFEVDGSIYPLGLIPATVSNPSPLDCDESNPAQIEVIGPPAVGGVEPDAVCAMGSGRVTVTGTGFRSGDWVEIGGIPAEDVLFIDSETLDVLPAPATPSGPQEVVVVSEAACIGVLDVPLRIVAEPIVFFVDPPVVYGQVAVQATIYVADVVGEVTGVTLVDPSGGTTALPFTWDPSVPGLVYADLPAGLADGAYDLTVSLDGTCGGTLTGGVVVSSDLQIPLSEVDPAFAWTYDFTPVAIRTDDPIPAGFVGLQDTPRVVLIGPDGSGTTTPVLGVSWKSSTRLSAVIPVNMPTGSYDVLVTNPDGSVGLLTDGLEVTQDPPPKVEDVGPATLENSSDQLIAIKGRDFRDPAVELDCLDPDTAVTTTVSASVGSWTFSAIDATVPTTQFNTAICLVRVVNSDGTVAEWSSLSITNPAQNLFPWKVGTDMVEARRAPAGASGRTTSVDRYVYAIGGDAGDPSSAKTTIEVAPVDIFGTMGAWTVLPRELPEPRTLAQAVVVGRFIYLIGGNDSLGPVDSVWRARILDPLDVPFFETLSVSAGTTGSGMTEGTWRYRVSALMDPTDAANPGGETLPSDTVSITLPATPDPLQLELAWTPVYGAVGYRVYRTAAADMPAGAEEFLAEVTTHSFVDPGLAVTPGELPLPPGALGNWAPMPSMLVPREAPCVAKAPDPFPDPEKLYIYAAGGQDASKHSSIEYLELILNSADEQTALYWTPSSQSLSAARDQCGGYGVDYKLHTVVQQGESWVYFAGGRTSGNESTAVDSGLVLEGGDLGNWGTISNMTPARAGFAHVSASNFIYAFGGQNASPNQSGTSGQFSTGSLPDVVNWNSLGTSLSEKRYLPGSAQESAVIFVLGGQTDLAPATRTTDWTNF